MNPLLYCLPDLPDLNDLSQFILSGEQLLQRLDNHAQIMGHEPLLSRLVRAKLDIARAAKERRLRDFAALLPDLDRLREDRDNLTGAINAYRNAIDHNPEIREAGPEFEQLNEDINTSIRDLQEYLNRLNKCIQFLEAP